MGFGPLTLLLPEATEARRSAQLPGFGLLTAGHVEGLVKTRLRLQHWHCCLSPACAGEEPPCNRCSSASHPRSPVRSTVANASASRASPSACLCSHTLRPAGQDNTALSLAPRGPGGPPGPSASAPSLLPLVPGRRRPTPHDGRLRQVLCKPLLGRERHQGLCPLPVRGLVLPARLMQHVAKSRAGARLGVRQGLGQGERLSQALQSLVRIAEDPEGQGRMVEATHAGVMPVVEPCVRVVLLGIVEPSPCSRWALAVASSPLHNKVDHSAWWASRRSAASWTCWARRRSRSPSARARWYSARLL